MSNVPTWLQESIEEQSSSLPDWALQFQQQQWDAFSQVGLPTRKDERFKYTDISSFTKQDFTAAKRVEDGQFFDVINQHRLQRGENILLVFINGYFMPALSDRHKLPKEVIVCPFNTAMQHYADLIKPYWIQETDVAKYPFASLNAAKAKEGLFFYVPENCQLTMPVHLLSLATNGEKFAAHIRHLFVLEKRGQLTLIEEHFSLAEQDYLMNTVTHIVAQPRAQLEHYKIQHEGKKATHLAHTFIQQKQDSTVSSTSFAIGAAFARDEIAVTLQGPGADCKTSGFYHLHYDNQYIDYHVDINHVAPRSHSEMLYKGILDKKSCAVFNGRLHVSPGAQKILAYQANHNLLLAKESEVYSKPELEIYADDVKCKHGASTGQIDQDAIFYFRSRGISKAEAVNMLLQGFADEVLQRVTHDGVKLRIEEWMS